MSMKDNLGRIRRRASRQVNSMRVLGRQKYFCIGFNKTGTTTLAATFRGLGFIVGNQREAELLVPDWCNNDYRGLKRYCRSASVFQDAPFSYPGTYRQLAKAFPNAKFILSVRDDPEQWYRSLTRFHSKLFGVNGNLPTTEDLIRATYVAPGYMYNFVRVHGTSDSAPYDKDILINNYLQHIADVQKFFYDSPERLLIINVAKREDYQAFRRFVSVPTDLGGQFVWKNKT